MLDVSNLNSPKPHGLKHPDPLSGLVVTACFHSIYLNLRSSPPNSMYETDMDSTVSLPPYQEKGIRWMKKLNKFYSNASENLKSLLKTRNRN